MEFCCFQVPARHAQAGLFYFVHKIIAHRQKANPLIIEGFFLLPKQQNCAIVALASSIAKRKPCQNEGQTL
jgi:hypothetical protein